MPRASVAQTNFTAGEISPKLLSRSDVARYANGVKTLTNFIVHPHGGATRRPGTLYAAEAKYNTATRVIPFEFGTTAAYTLEFGEKYIRFFKDNAQLTVSPTVTGATKANPCVITCVGHGFLDGTKVTFASVGGMTELNGNTYTITSVSDDTFELSGTDSTGFTTYTSGGTATGAYELLSPYSASELFDIQFAQSADVMWLVHNDVPVAKLSRTADTSWSLDHYAPTSDPFDGTALAISGITKANPGVVTCATHGLTTGDRVYISGVVGMTEVNNKIFTVTVLTTTTFELDEVDTTGYTTYSSAGNVYKTNNDWPGAVTFFEQRLCFGRTDDDPHKIWMSKSADYEDMTTGTNDDDAIAYTIASGKVNAIHWLVGADDLIIGTSGSEHIATGDNTGPITPTNISIKRNTTRGCAMVQPVQIDNTVLFLQRALRKIREIGYSFDSDSYTAPDLTLLAEHITDPSIIEMDYQQETDQILWSIRSDGYLIGMTYIKDQNVLAFHKHQTDGLFKSVAVIPATDHDQLWCVVERTIDGNTVKYIEYFDSGIWSDQEDAYYVDCGIKYDSTTTTSITGLDHLEAESVSIYGDGSILPAETVASGAVTADISCSVFAAGLPFTSTIVTLEVDQGNPAGNAMGKQKSTGTLYIRLYKSLGGTLDGKSIIYRSISDNMDEAPPMLTGDYKVPKLGWSSENNITITTSDPGPFTVLGIYQDLEVSQL